MKARWSLWLAVLALIGAGLACSIRVTTAHIRAANLVRDPDGATRTLSFRPDDTFYLIVELANAPADSEVKVVWVQVGAGEDGADRVVGEDVVRSGSGTLVFSAEHPERQWRVGDYRAEVYLDGEQTHSLSFRVRF